MKKRVTAIVPAYNRERSIHHVLGKLINSPLILEVICVYDGNDKLTLKKINLFPQVKLVHRKKRYGQAAAAAKGTELAKGDIVLFLDADIQGLSSSNIQKLVEPLLKKEYDCVVGYRSSKMESSVGVPLGGERAYFKKDLLPYVKKFEKKGYGLVLYLNYLYRHKKRKVVHMKGVYSVAKHAKYSYATATKQYVHETYQVCNDIVRQPNPFSYIKNSYLSYVYFRDKNVMEHMKESRLIKASRYLRLPL